MKVLVTFTLPPAGRVEKIVDLEIDDFAKREGHIFTDVSRQAVNAAVDGLGWDGEGITQFSMEILPEDYKQLKIVFTREKIPGTIFLAGPTARADKPVPSWRLEALKILEELKFDGHVFVPEERNARLNFDYDAQIDWENAGLNAAGVIVFWVPRDLDVLPAFTTNIEFGRFLGTRKILCGWPEGAPKMGYFQKMCDDYHLPVFHDLQTLLNTAVTKLQ